METWAVIRESIRDPTMSAYESFVECCQDLTWGTFVVTLSDVLISVLEEMGENQPVDVDDDDDDLYTLDRQRLPHVPMNLPKGWHTIVSRTIELVTTFMEGRDDSSQADDRVSGYPESTPDTSTEATMALLHQIATTQTAILTRMDGISADVSQLRSEAIQRDTSLTDMHVLTRSIHDRVKTLEDVVGGVNSGTQSLISLTSIMERRLPTSSPMARSSSVADLDTPTRVLPAQPTRPHSRRPSLTGAT